MKLRLTCVLRKENERKKNNNNNNNNKRSKYYYKIITLNNKNNYHPKEVKKKNGNAHCTQLGTLYQANCTRCQCKKKWFAFYKLFVLNRNRDGEIWSKKARERDRDIIDAERM